MKYLKKWLFSFLLLLWVVLPFSFSLANNSSAPNFEDDFAKSLVEWDEKLYNISWVSWKNTIKGNIEKLFFPNGWGNGWALRDILRYVWMFLVFIFIVMAAINLITSQWKPEKTKEAITSLLYILIWAFLFFWSMWIFSTVFNISALQWTNGSSASVNERLTSESGLLFFILSFLKWAAFFIAIIMLVITWFKMMNPKTGESGDGKKLAKNLVNVIVALVWMKVVDFIYYIASQSNFAEEAGNFIVEIMKFLAYLSGSVMVIMLIYAWYLLIVDGWKWDNFKKAKNTMINMVLAIIALFFFLFIIYQIFAELGGAS